MTLDTNGQRIEDCYDEPLGTLQHPKDTCFNPLAESEDGSICVAFGVTFDCDNPAEGVAKLKAISEAEVRAFVEYPAPYERSTLDVFVNDVMPWIVVLLWVLTFVAWGLHYINKKWGIFE